MQSSSASKLHALISLHVTQFENVSSERIWAELQRILSGSNAAQILERMRIDGMLSRILPGWDADIRTQHSIKSPEVDVIISRLVLLASDISHERWRRLEHDLRAITLSNRDRKRFMELHRLIGHLPSNTADVRRYRAVVGEMIDSHLAIETALNPINAAPAIKLIEEVPSLKAGNDPLVDGHLLVNETD